MLFRAIALSAMVAAIGFGVACSSLSPQREQIQEPVYVSDNGDGTYKNPVIYADYSDPDVIRVGDDFYMTASSFICFPGLPILHSKDLVNWTLIGHAIDKYPLPGFEYHVNGGGVWAPAMRFHDEKFYIYFGDPDNGVFMTSAKNPAGPWEPLVCVKKTRGWIDTCPFWDDDGQAYMVHAFAGSRHNGVSNILDVCRLSPDGTAVLDEGRRVVDGKSMGFTTVEGPKLYKRNGFYYIMAPGGGVSAGYQIVFRSMNIDGPYESRVVLRQGSSAINGPHQGGWVTTATGEDWFLHFQDRGGYGRVSILEPMKWEKDWPVMGVPMNDPMGDPAAGQAVMMYQKPNAGPHSPPSVPQTSDEFTGHTLGLQWQWFGNYQEEWISCVARPGFLRMNAVPLDKDVTLFERPNLLLQKIPAERFTATARFDAAALGEGESAGLLVTGSATAALQVHRENEGIRLTRTTTVTPLKAKESKPAAQVATTMPAPSSSPGRKFFPGPDVEDASIVISGTVVYLRVSVKPSGPPGDPKKLPKAVCGFSYSNDGVHYSELGKPCAITDNGWIGAKLGLFCNGKAAMPENRAGHVDVDWFRFAPNE